MPFRDRLDSDPFFARIRALDLECPACGTVAVCQGGPRSPYNRRTALFTCPSCHTIFALGVLAYRIPPGPRPTLPPPDWTPTPRQAAALRKAITGHEVRSPRRLPARSHRNIVLRPGCRCTLPPADNPESPISPSVLIVHPGCPVHGVARSVSKPASSSRPE